MDTDKTCMVLIPAGSEPSGAQGRTNKYTAIEFSEPFDLVKAPESAFVGALVIVNGTLYDAKDLEQALEDAGY